MKKIITLSITFILLCLLCRAQHDCGKAFHPMFGVGIGFTHLKETSVYLEAGAFSGMEPTWYGSFVMETYNSKQDPQRNWPVFDIGPRINYILSRSDWGWLQLYGEYRFATQGKANSGTPVIEKDLLGGYYNWHPAVGVSWNGWIPDKKHDTQNGFVKTWLSYGPGKVGRFKAGIAILGVF